VVQDEVVVVELNGRVAGASGSGGTATSPFRMSKQTRHSHIVNGVSRVDRDSLQGWIIHP